MSKHADLDDRDADDRLELILETIPHTEPNPVWAEGGVT